MMISFSIDGKIIRIIKNLYQDTEFAVVIDGNITEWFSVKVGVRKGCLLSPTLFNIFLDFVMDELKSIPTIFHLSDRLSCDIRYADDTALVALMFEKLELSTSELKYACRKWGMKINTGKTKVISDTQARIRIDGADIENVDSFIYLDSVLPNFTDDIIRRTALAAQSFGRLQAVIWRNRDINLNLKVRLFNSLIVPIATYAAETWTLMGKG